MAAAPVIPSWNGFLATNYDAALLLELGLRGLIPIYHSPPANLGLGSLIQSGTVLIISQPTAARIWNAPRFRDGRSWSDSRSLRNGYLVYRERARAADPVENTAPELGAPALYRPILGSHLGRNGFKQGGLVKKAISFVIAGTKYTINCYYTRDDIVNGQLVRPRSSLLWAIANLAALTPRQAIWNSGITITNDGGIAHVHQVQRWANVVQVPPPAAAVALIAPIVPMLPAPFAPILPAPLGPQPAALPAGPAAFPAAPSIPASFGPSAAFPVGPAAPAPPATTAHPGLQLAAAFSVASNIPASVGLSAAIYPSIPGAPIVPGAPVAPAGTGGEEEDGDGEDELDDEEF
ncbi:hypothetical protein VTJ04DRAFT_523 [Mycothermus thermophilus]|uniref:uncharacterized protein n=1 Tax=Humicola insolens TaxID=85995 RepID=UPI003744AAEB